MSAEEITIETFSANVFKTVNIHSLVWIDDFFGCINRATNQTRKENCILTIQALHESMQCETLHNFPALKNIDFSAPWPQIYQDLDTAINNIDAMESFLEKNFEESIANSDLTDEVFEEIKSIFEQHLDSCNIHTLSLAKWREQKNIFLHTTAERILFLVDLDFSDEMPGAKEAGKSIIKNILPNLPTDSYCVLFTHEVDPGSKEEEKRNDFIKEMELHDNKACFSILSKKVLKNEKIGINYKLPALLQRLYLRKINAALTMNLTELLTDALINFAESLSQQSIYELERVLFDSSEHEGISEFELLVRLLNIKQKNIINNIMTTEEKVIKKIAALRELRQCGDRELAEKDKKIKNYNKKLKSVSDEFINLRYAEIFNKDINNLCTPLTCGDIFQNGSSGTLEQYILIAQPCDLIVRSDGERNINEAILIPITQKNNEKICKSEKSKTYTVSIIRDNEREDAFIFNLSEAFTVNINFLDFCVFNPHGYTTIEASSLQNYQANLQYMKGWRKKYTDLITTLAPIFNTNIDDLESKLPQKFKNFCLDPQKFTIEKGRNKIFGVTKFQRIKRLNEPYIHHLLRKYHEYKSRNDAAHDFNLSGY